MEVGPEGVANFGVLGGFFGTYEVAFGEEAGGEGVLGGAGFALDGAGASRGQGVNPISGNLSFGGWHGGSFSFSKTVDST
jgi:hypothetical protein